MKDGKLLLQSTTGQTAINLTKDSADVETMPAFSPDGEQIAFRSSKAGGGIFVMGRTGESARRVTTRGYHPSWFPDGKRIVFSTYGSPGPESIPSTFSDIVVADVATGETRTLVSGYLAIQPRVSPHGLRIAYWAVRVGLQQEGSNRDIWTVDADGKNPVRATTHVANDWNPVWSPDGRWLYFLSNRSGSMNLWRVAINEATGQTRGEPQPLTAPAPYVAHFSLSSDGRVGAYSAVVSTGNVARVAFDPKHGVVKGSVESITTGTHDFFGSLSPALTRWHARRRERYRTAPALPVRSTRLLEARRRVAGSGRSDDHQPNADRLGARRSAPSVHGFRRPATCRVDLFVRRSHASPCDEPRGGSLASRRTPIPLRAEFSGDSDLRYDNGGKPRRADPPGREVRRTEPRDG